MTGKFGQDFIDDYVKILQDFPRFSIYGLASQVFKLALEAIGEVWRRFIHATSATPFTLFQMMDMNQQDFLAAYHSLRAKIAKCAQCADLEFTQPLMVYLQSSEHDVAEMERRCCHVRELLRSIATHGPTSSDLVECLHGYCQKLLQRGGGGVRPSDEGAQQRVLWSLVTKAYEKDRQFIFDHCGDAKAAYRFAHYGRKGHNQYSAAKNSEADGPPARFSKSKKELTAQKLDRLFAFNSDINTIVSKPRKLCGPSDSFVHSLRSQLRMEHLPKALHGWRAAEP